MKTILKSESEFKTTSEILENSYPEISKELKKDYIIQYEDYDAFCEITHQGEVVGFYTFTQDDAIAVINEFYILKSHRGQNIAFKCLSDLFAIPNTVFFLNNPNTSMIQVLLKNDLAYKISDDIICSGITFMVCSDDVFKNSKIKKAYRNIGEREYYTSNFYDINLKCTVTSNDSKIVKRGGTLIVIEPRKADIKKYTIRKKLKNITLKSLDDKMLTIYESRKDTEEFIEKSYDYLVELNSIDNIMDNIDAGDELKDEIAQSIKKSIANDELDPAYVKIRLSYLLDNPDKIHCPADLELMPEKCPLCESEILKDYYECPVCAFPLKINQTPDMLNIDPGNKLYREVIEKADENNWDLDEIFDLQCLCGTFEFIRMSKMAKFFPIENVDESNKVKIGSVGEYAVKNGYLKECSYDDYINLVENEFSRSDLKIEVEHYGLKDQFTKRGLIKEIKNNVAPEDISIKYLETEKGTDLIENSEILNFYMDYLRTFLFCEFKKFFDEHDYSVSEAGDKFIQREYEKGIENKNWRIYKQLLKYQIEKSENATECVKLAMKMLIYDVNCDDLKDDINQGYELDTLMYLMEYLPDSDADFENLFDESFKEFEIKELKHNKEEAYGTFLGICEGEFVENLKKYMGQS